MIKLWSKFNVFVNSSCNFLCDKLFNRPEIGYKPSKNDSSECYGKRMKFSDDHWEANDFLKRTESPCPISMQKENVIISDDDEDECCVIAEIPRRKKPGASLAIDCTPKFTPCKDETRRHDPFSTFTFKKEPVDDEIEQVKIMNNNSGKDAFSGSHIKNKIFNNQRASLNYGKVMKCRSFKNHLKRKMNFLQESYRLAEKFQYLQLLRSQTSHHFGTHKFPIKPIGYGVKSIPVIDLTDEQYEGNEKPVSEVQSKSSDDQDIQILREIPGVRSFQEMLKIKALNSAETSKAIVPRHSSCDYKSSDLNGTPVNIISLVDDDDDDSDTNQKSGAEALEERLRNFMQITGSEAQGVESNSEEHYYLPELTCKQEEKIKRALVLHPSQEILVEGFGLQITRQDMHTLMGLNWLNDEVINFYMNLIMERSKLNRGLPGVYAFNTFFYPKLVSSDYASVRRWTKKVDLFSYDLILVPIHLAMHWCLSVIDFRSKTLRYYDSIGSPNNACLERLLMYLRAECLDKKKKVFNISDWDKSNVEDIPQQMNGSDCGVFSCMFAEHLARDCPILFTQDDMPYFRKKMVIEILEKKLLT